MKKSIASLKKESIMKKKMIITPKKCNCNLINSFFLKFNIIFKMSFKVFEHKLRFHDIYIQEYNSAHNEILVDCNMYIINDINDSSISLKWTPSEKIKEYPEEKW